MCQTHILLPETSLPKIEIISRMREYIQSMDYLPVCPCKLFPTSHLTQTISPQPLIKVKRRQYFLLYTVSHLTKTSGWDSFLPYLPPPPWPSCKFIISPNTLCAQGNCVTSFLYSFINSLTHSINVYGVPITCHVVRCGSRCSGSQNFYSLQCYL